MKRNLALIVTGIAVLELTFNVTAQTPPTATRSRLPSSGWQGMSGSAQTNRLSRGPTQVAKRIETTQQAAPTYMIGERGPDHKEWLRVTTTRDAQGQTVTRTNRAYIELATGMHYREGTEWKETKEWIEPAPGGAVARYGPHKAFFADNLNTAGATVLDLPDGQRLASHFLGLIFADTVSGKSMWAAQVQDCQGQIVSSNQVLYAGALGSLADVRYTYRRNGWEQDIILKQRPALPQGFDPNSTVIQAVTEFLSPPQPARTTRTASMSQELDIQHEDLNWVTARIGHGQVFTARDNARRPGVTTFNRWLKMDGRDILIEQVPVIALENELAALPRQAGMSPMPPANHANEKLIAKGISLPAQRMARQSTNQMMVAAATAPVQGLVWDYLVELTGSLHNYTLRSDTTYYVSGPVNLTGVATLESAVIKFTNSWSCGIKVVDQPLVCKTSQYFPAVFTTKDDDFIGVQVSGSTGEPHRMTEWFSYLVTPAGTLHNSRFLHASMAVTVTEFNSDEAVIRNCQFVDSDIAVVSGAGGVSLQNNLLKQCGLAVFYSEGLYPQPPFFLAACHITMDGGRLVQFPDYALTEEIGVFARNSVFANVTGQWVEDGEFIDYRHNGFFNSTSPFGLNQVTSSENPFQSDGNGNYYLKPDSGFRAVGTTAIDPVTLSDLKKRSTQPPINFPRFMEVSGELTLFPQVPRYVSGPPDLGYHYDVLDYTIAVIALWGKVEVKPGTVVGFREDFVEETWWPFCWTLLGFELMEGSSFVSRGTPSQPITYVDVQAVQEEPTLATFAFFVPWFLPNPNDNPPPFADFRFSNFYASPGVGIPGYIMAWNYQFLDFFVTPGTFHFWAGFNQWFDALSDYSTINLILRDCNLVGGGINLGPPVGIDFNPPCAINWVNNRFDRVNICLIPDYVNDPPLEMDMALQAWNNLFRGGRLRMAPLPATAGNWIFKDNLFDKVAFEQYTPWPLDHDYNAYWKRTAAELEPWQADQLLANDDDGGVDTLNDRVLAAAPGYQSGPLGDYYLLASSPLYQTTKRGSRSVAEAGLHHYTTRVDQTKDGAQSGNAIIGQHYVATANSGSAQPKDSDGDGIPDFAEDFNGDSVRQSSETDWTVADLDPIHFVGLPTGSTLPPGKVRIFLQVTNKLDNLMVVSLAADDSPIPGVESLRPPFILPLSLEVDTKRLRNGTHTLQAFATWPDLDENNLQSTLTVPSESIEVTIANEISFPDWRPGFGPNEQGQVTVWMTAQSARPSIDYQIDIYSPSYGYVDTIFGVSTADGSIEASWNDWFGAAEYRPVFTTTWSEGESRSATESSGSATAIAPLKNLPYDNWPAQAEGAWVVAYQAVEFPLQDFSLLDDAMDTIGYAGWVAGGLIPNPPDPIGQPYFMLQYGYQQAPRATRENQWKTLTNSLAALPARNFYYGGHGWGHGIGADIAVYDHQVSQLLHTERSGDPDSHPYRFVFLDGCETARGGWCSAFGIPIAGSGDNLSSYLKYNQRPAAFVAWSKTVEHTSSDSQLHKLYEDNEHHLFPPGKYSYYDYGRLKAQFAYYRTQFIWYWTGNLGIIAQKELWEALDKAYEDTKDSGVNVAWKEYNGLVIYGYRKLHWQQFNHGDWQTEARQLLGE